MDLTFNKDGGSFVAEFVTTADFNLHIEKSGGDFRIMQKTVENGLYDYIDGLYIPAGNPVIDYDFVASIYPKYIKIVSEVEPTLAVVTSAGEVTEIKPEVREFFVKIYDVDTGGNVFPVDTPTLRFEYSRANMTWEEFVSENSENFFIQELPIGDQTVKVPVIKQNPYIAISKSQTEVTTAGDVIIPNHEYFGSYLFL